MPAAARLVEADSRATLDVRDHRSGHYQVHTQQPPQLQSPTFRSKATEPTKPDRWLPPPENINQMFSYEKITRMQTGNFNLNRPLSSYMTNKIENTIQDFQNKTFSLRKRDPMGESGKEEQPTLADSSQKKSPARSGSKMERSKHASASVFQRARSAVPFSRYSRTKHPQYSALGRATGTLQRVLQSGSPQHGTTSARDASSTQKSFGLATEQYEDISKRKEAVNKLIDSYF